MTVKIDDPFKVVRRSPYQDKELTTADVAQCSDFITKLAVDAFMARTRVLSTTIREWMAAERVGTSTTHADFDEAVRRYLTR